VIRSGGLPPEVLRRFGAELSAQYSAGAVAHVSRTAGAGARGSRHVPGSFLTAPSPGVKRFPLAPCGPVEGPKSTILGKAFLGFPGPPPCIPGGSAHFWPSANCVVTEGDAVVPMVFKGSSSGGCTDFTAPPQNRYSAPVVIGVRKPWLPMTHTGGGTVATDGTAHDIHGRVRAGGELGPGGIPLPTKFHHREMGSWALK